MNYAVGHNTPGYSPESDVWVTEDYDSAKRALIDDLERHADWLDEIGLHDQAEEVSAECEDLNLASVGTEWSTTVPSSDSEHDLGLSFWLNVTEEEPEED